MSEALVGYILIAILFTLAFGIMVWMGRFREPDELWVGFIKRIIVVMVVAASTTIAFGLFYDSVDESDSTALLVLQVAKDAPGLMLIATCVGHIRSTAVSLSGGTGALDRILRECPKILAAGLLAAIVVGAFGDAQSQLEDGSLQSAVLYRSLIYVPTAVYSLLLSITIFSDAQRLGRLDPDLKRRYYLFALGALTWALLAVDHLARPTVLTLVGSGLDSVAATSADLAVAGLWIAMVFFWVYGFASRPRFRTRADIALAATNDYQASSTSLVARLDDPSAIWRREIAYWQRTLAELAETVRECCRDSGRSEDEANRQARVAKTALNIVAMIGYEPHERRDQTRKELAAHRKAYEATARGIVEESPAKRALLEDRVALAAKDSLQLTDDNQDRCLRSGEDWVQPLALISAELDLLPHWKTVQLLEPGAASIDDEVYQALRDVRFLLRDRPVNL